MLIIVMPLRFLTHNQAPGAFIMGSWRYQVGIATSDFEWNEAIAFHRKYSCLR